MLTLDKLEIELDAIIKALHVKYKRQRLINDYSVQFVIEEFGVLVCGLHAADYSMINDVLVRNFIGWRIVYVALTDSILSKKEEIIWDLMRSGYIRHIRNVFPRQFRSVLQTNDFSRQIINKRLKVWADRPMYKYLIEENKNALKYGFSYILSIDPAFFDYMPEEE